MPYSSASAVKPCPIETSASVGMRRAKRRQIGDGEVVAGIDGKPGGKCRVGGFSEPFQLLGGLCRIIVASAVRTGVELDAVGAGVARRRPCRPDRDRQTAKRGSRPSSAAARSASRKSAWRGEIPAMVGGRLRRIVRHQRHLVRLALFHKTQKILARIALDVELGFGELVVDQRAQHRQVGMARVPLVRAADAPSARARRRPARCGRAPRRWAMAGRAGCAAWRSR